MGVTDTINYKRIDDSYHMSQIVRSEVILGIHMFFQQNGFVLVDPPILHETINNKKGEIYLSIDNEGYSLNSSNALYMTAFASEYQKVYAISPSFRNEQDSFNHLLEFTMLEAEIVGMKFDELVDFVIKLIRAILEYLSFSKRLKNYTNLQHRLNELLIGFAPTKMTYRELNDYLCEKCGREVIGDNDLSDIDYMISNFIEKPIIITDYPERFASWTAKRKDKGISYALNLLLPDSYGELCEGCERIDNPDVFLYKFSCAKITNLEWYVDAVRKINDSRCGFGIGIDRFTRWIIGAEKITDILFFPRYHEDRRMSDVKKRK